MRFYKFFLFNLFEFFSFFSYQVFLAQTVDELIATSHLRVMIRYERARETLCDIIVLKRRTMSHIIDLSTSLRLRGGVWSSDWQTTSGWHVRKHVYSRADPSLAHIDD